MQLHFTMSLARPRCFFETEAVYYKNGALGVQAENVYKIHQVILLPEPIFNRVAGLYLAWLMKQIQTFP